MPTYRPPTVARMCCCWARWWAGSDPGSPSRPSRCGPAEVVPPECGRLFVPGDARAAADALIGLFRTPGLAARVGEAGRRRAERVYDVRDSSSRWSELVEEAASRHRAGEVRVR